MKELYLAKIKSIKGGIEPYMETISNLIQEKDERKRVHLAYCRNMINGFDGDYVNPFNVQINIYNCIHEIVDHVNGWLDSFNSETIINDIPSLIDSYKGGGDFNAIVREAIEKKKSKPSAPSPEPDNPSPEPSAPSGTANNIIPELEKMLNDGIKSMKEEMANLPKQFRDKIEKATAIYMDDIKKAVVDTLDENKDKPNGSTKEERKVEKGQDEKGEDEKEQSEEKDKQEPKEQEIIIQAPVNAATCKKFSSLLSMSVDSKEYRDIFDTLSESQQRYLSLLRASMNKDNQYILAHKNDNSISSSDYNELLKLAKSLTASSKKGSSQKQKNEKKQQQQAATV